MNRLLRKGNTNIFVGVLAFLAGAVAVVAVVKLDVFGTKGGTIGRAYNNDLEDIARVDPNLILYEESPESVVTSLKKVQAIAVDSKGHMYIAGDKAVVILGYSVGPDRGLAVVSGGDLPGSISLADEPKCLTVTDDGTIYVGLKDRVEVYDGAGKRLASWQSLGADARLTSIAVWKDNVFVADAGNRVVLRYDLQGKLINRIGEKDIERNVPGFVVPSAYFDLVVPRDGLLRVVNPGARRIEAYTFDGDFEFSWGRTSAAIDGFCGCCNPVNIALLPDGGFVTCEKGLTRVKIYDSQGVFVGVVAGPEQLVAPGLARVCNLPAQCQIGGFDVAVDAAGHIFVLDTIKNVVRVFTRKKAG